MARNLVTNFKLLLANLPERVRRRRNRAWLREQLAERPLPVRPSSQDGTLARLLILLPFAILVFPGSGFGEANQQSPSSPSLPEIRRLIDQGEYAKSEALARRLLVVVESTSGPSSVDAAETLDLLVESLWRGGKTRGPEARSLGERSLGIKEHVLGADHPSVARSLDVLGDLLTKIGSYEEAKADFERALRIQEKALGRDDPEVGTTLNSLGILLYTTGDYAGSEERLRRALEIRQRLFGGGHPTTAQSLNALGYLRFQRGDYSDSRSLLEKALEIREQALGPDHPDVAATLYYLSGVLVATGDYLQARPMRERALAIYEKRLGPEHPNVAACLNSLAIMLRNAGDFQKAREYYERSLSIMEKTLGPDHANVGAAMNNIAELRALTGDYTGARQAYERALEIKEKAVGPDHPGVATILHNLSALLTQTGEFDEARSYLDRAIAIRTKVYGPDHPEIARSLGNLAELLYLEGEPTPPKPGGNEHTVPPRSVSRVEPRDATPGSVGSARVSPMTDTAVAALDAALRAETMGREHLRLTIRTLAERPALRFAVLRASGLDLALSIAARGTDPASTQRIWDALIRSRALVLDEMATRHRSLGAVDKPKISELSERLASARQKLAELTLRNLGRDSSEHYRDLLAKARGEEEQDERLLAEQSSDFRAIASKTSVGWEQVKNALPPDSALVAYARYRPPARASSQVRPSSGAHSEAGAGIIPEIPEPSPHYLALVLRSDQANPFVVPLGSSEDLDALVRAWAVEISTAPSVVEVAGKRDEARYRQSGERLRRAVWDPVARIVGRPQIVFVVPDGTLNLVSLASLPSGKHDYLVEAGILFHYLSAERDLVPRVGPESKGRGILALGGPDFDARPDRVSTGIGTGSTAETGAVSAARTAVSASYRGTVAGCTEFQSMRFPPLPASGAEAHKVAASWRTGLPRDHPNTEEALELTGASAGEAEFKARAAGQRIVHLATHAFFVDDRKCQLSPEGSRSNVVEPGNTSPSAYDENPLLLTGLALAGANLRQLPNAADAEDGILTGEEIASLDLSGVEWVVLSACNTGLGKLQSGEGVLGLRRAFQIAGVHTLIMSLWKVEDWAANDWMERLYKGRLSGLSTADSVRNASLQTLRFQRSSGKNTHPYYWGAFVAAGDWR